MQLSNNVNFMWRLAKSTYFLSQIEAARDKDRQRFLVYESKELADAALKLDEKSANAHKWLASTIYVIIIWSIMSLSGYVWFNAADLYIK